MAGWSPRLRLVARLPTSRLTIRFRSLCRLTLSGNLGSRLTIRFRSLCRLTLSGNLGSRLTLSRHSSRLTIRFGSLCRLTLSGNLGSRLTLSGNLGSRLTIRFRSLCRLTLSGLFAGRVPLSLLPLGNHVLVSLAISSLPGPFDSDPSKPDDQLVNVVVPMRTRELDGIPIEQRRKAIRQLAGLWDPCSVDQHWDDSYVPLKAGLDLESHIIPRVVKTSIALLIRGSYPATPDHRQQHVAAPDPIANDTREPCSYLDAVDIEENPVVPQVRLERLGESVRRIWHVIAAVAHKHSNIALGPTALGRTRWLRPCGPCLVPRHPIPR